MFVQAGFNRRHRSTGIRGWTRNVNGNKSGFAPAELIRFLPSGELAWAGKRFLVWGDVCVFGSWEEFDLAGRMAARPAAIAAR